MRILMLSQFYPPVIGGEERHVRSLSAGLIQRGHDVMVATQWCPGEKDAEEDNGIKIRRIRGTMQRSSALFSDAGRRHAPPFPDPELTLGLWRLVEAFRPDVVHAHNWMVHSFAPLKNRSGAPLVLTLHDYGLVCAKKNLMRGEMVCSGPGLLKCVACSGGHYGTIKGGVTTLSNWMMNALSPVDRLLTVSSAVAEGNGLVDQSIPYEVVPNFIPDDLGAAINPEGPLPEPLPDEDYLLFVGDLRRQKGVHTLIKAYEQLESRPPLVMIGRRCPDTPTDLPEGVRILTNWPHPAIMRAWQRSLIGLAPSIWPEPCATVVLEAMACGRPVIASDIGGMPDMVEHDSTGLLVTPNDPEALAIALKRLLDDRGLARRLGQAGRKRVVRFQAHTVVPRIEAIYTSLLVRRAA